MIKLYFCSAKFPRTIGRKEWRDIWRWKRVTEKQLAKAAQEQLDAFIAFGSTMPEHIRKDVMDKMIYPPLLIHDKQQI